MTTYINYQYKGQPKETVDEFEKHRDAMAAIKEYRMVGAGDPGQRYWLSSRSTKEWRERE